MGQDFRSMRKTQLSDEVASYVRELIMSGQLKEGGHVRLEHLAKQLGVSLTPVREGLLTLRGEGFVQLEPRRGFIVSPLSRQDIEDLFSFQAEVAGELAARAAVQITPEQLEEVAKIQQSLEDASLDDDQDMIEQTNYLFHRAINLSAGSRKLGWMLMTVARYAPRRFYATIHGWQQASVDDHRSIVAALRNGSAADASEAMKRHILHAGTLLIAHLESTGFWDSIEADADTITASVR